MKHAGPAALDTIEPLLQRLRAIGGLREKTRGVFYLRSKAFLHFHEDPSGLYADIRAPGGAHFDRLKLGAAACSSRRCSRARRLPLARAG